MTKDKVITTPQVIDEFSDGEIFDFQMDTFILREGGCFVWKSPENNRTAWTEICNLRIRDERGSTTVPAITIQGMNRALIRSVSVNGATLAMCMTNCWDAILERITLIHGVSGLLINDNCNHVIARSLTIEKMSGTPLTCRNSRMLNFDSSCKIHGNPEDKNPRSAAIFGNCGSVIFRTSIMHQKPEETKGVVLFYGDKTEQITFEPHIYRTSDGPAYVLRNTPADLKLTANVYEYREPSLVDPK